MLQVVVLLMTYKLMLTGRIIAKRRKLSILELTFKSLNDTNFPEYLRLSTHAVCAYNLRSSVAPLLCIPKESGTFQDTAATFFNSLPSHAIRIRIIFI